MGNHRVLKHSVSLKRIPVAAILCLALVFPSVGSVRPKQIEVVIIHSYHQGYAWTESQHQGFVNALNSAALPGYKINYSTEYLDTKRVELTPEYKNDFLKYLRNKHRNHSPDIIYTTDDNAIQLVLSAITDLGWKSSVIFSGVNNITLIDSLDRQRVTGVFEQKGIEPSILLAKSIRPGIKQIVFLGDGRPTDQAIGVKISEISSKYTDIQIIHIKSNRIINLLAQLGRIHSDIVILTTVGGVRDENDYLLELGELVRRLASTGKIILTMEDAYFLPGVVGGYMTSGRLQGSAAALLASRVIKGEKITSLKPVTESPNDFILDWRMLNKFDIRLNPSRLQKARIINEPLPFIEKYQHILIKLLVLILVVVSAIALLFVVANHRKKRLIIEHTTDKLTGLPNRSRLLQDLKKGSKPVLALIDINNFSAINNLYGFELGDQVIVRISERIAKYMENGEILYRFGGDQFAVLSGPDSSPTVFEKLIGAVVKKVSREHHSFGDLEIYATIVAGISNDEDALIIAGAEHALQEAKYRNDGYVVDDSSTEEADRQKENILWAHKLSVALSKGKVQPYFQPIVHNTSGKIVKYEALVRIKDEDDTIVSPFAFLEAAKQTRQYALLTRTMIELSLDAIHDNRVIISINFTVEDIRNPKTVLFFKEQVKKRGVADRVVIELTESEGIENYLEVARFIKEIKSLGCRVAIDDFGTGYSNFTHLMYLHADYLKIDGSIIQRVNDDNNSSVLVVKTLVDFAKRLGMETVAEYVDSREILEKVTALGVDYSQGFFIGKPSPHFRGLDQQPVQGQG